MNWVQLTDIEQLSAINQESKNQTVLIFKHSTSCSTSATALARLERKWNLDELSEIKTYFLNLLRYRSLSNAIADAYQVEHESPQVLLIQDGQCVYHESHWGISYDEIKEQLVQI